MRSMQSSRANSLYILVETKNDFFYSKESAILKANGVNIIIALGHSGLDVDQKIAKDCKDIDVVIGGHSHTFLYSGSEPDVEKAVDTYPVIVTRADGKRVPVVQAYAFTKYLGYLHLNVR